MTSSAQVSRYPFPAPKWKTQCPAGNSTKRGTRSWLAHYVLLFICGWRYGKLDKCFTTELHPTSAGCLQSLFQRPLPKSLSLLKTSADCTVPHTVRSRAYNLNCSRGCRRIEALACLGPRVNGRPACVAQTVKRSLGQGQESLWSVPSSLKPKAISRWPVPLGCDSSTRLLEGHCSH